VIISLLGNKFSTNYTGIAFDAVAGSMISERPTSHIYHSHAKTSFGLLITFPAAPLFLRLSLNPGLTRDIELLSRVEKQRAKKSKEFEGSAKPPTFRPPHFSEWLHVIGSLSDRLTVNFSIPYRHDEYIISCWPRAKHRN
jgi:hypothetical protein